MQRAHYVEGRRIAETAVLSDLAAEIELRREAFAVAFEQVHGESTNAHIGTSRALLARVGGSGFPTFALERDGKFTSVDVTPYFGRAELWESWLRRSVG